MRFLGGKWRKKNNGNGKGNRFSRFAVQATLLPSAERWPLRGGFERGTEVPL
jgi:hypothetical protein